MEQSWHIVPNFEFQVEYADDSVFRFLTFRRHGGFVKQLVKPSLKSLFSSFILRKVSNVCVLTAHTHRLKHYDLAVFVGGLLPCYFYSRAYWRWCCQDVRLFLPVLTLEPISQTEYNPLTLPNFQTVLRRAHGVRAMQSKCNSNGKPNGFQFCARVYVGGSVNKKDGMTCCAFQLDRAQCDKRMRPWSHRPSSRKRSKRLSLVT